MARHSLYRELCLERMIYRAKKETCGKKAPVCAGMSGGGNSRRLRSVADIAVRLCGVYCKKSNAGKADLAGCVCACRCIVLYRRLAHTTFLSRKSACFVAHWLSAALRDRACFGDMYRRRGRACFDSSKGAVSHRIPAFFAGGGKSFTSTQKTQSFLKTDRQKINVNILPSLLTRAL